MPSINDMNLLSILVMWFVISCIDATIYVFFFGEHPWYSSIACLSLIILGLLAPKYLNERFTHSNSS